MASHGGHTGVISGALLYIKEDLHANDFEQEAIVAAVLLGAMVGAAASGYLADRVSRRWTKVMSGAVYFLAALGCALSVNAEMLIGFRFLLGLAVGTASFVSPLYISEMAPPRIRGGLVSFNQLAVTSGILIAYLTNFAFKDVVGDWRWMLGLAALPGAALAVGMLSVPQTPRWLASVERNEQARDVLTDLRAGDPDADVDTEMHDIVEANDTEQESSIRDLAGRSVRPMLIVGTVGLLCGLLVLAVYFSSATLQQQAGYLALTGLLIFIASFAIGLGPVFWLLISEIFPVRVRSVAMSVCTIVNWGANFLVAQTFLTLGNAITRQGVFYLYAAVALAALLFFIAKVPETRGRSLEEVQSEVTEPDG